MEDKMTTIKKIKYEIFIKTHISTFYNAVRNSDVEGIKKWIRSGAKINQVDNDIEGSTPLNFVLNHVINYHMDINIIKFLIKHGADVNLADRRGNTPLHLVMLQNPFKVMVYVMILIKSGADVNMTNIYGSTPLHLALRMSFPNIKIVKLLIKNGANLNQLNNGGESPLYYALTICVDEKYAINLIKNGADINESNNKGMSSIIACLHNVKMRHLPILLAAGADQTGLDITYPDPESIQFNYPYYMKPISSMKPDPSMRFSKKLIYMTGFNAIRKRAGTICIAMQNLDLPAPQTIEIIVQACVPFAENLPYHYLWDLVVMVKHFHDRQSKKMLMKPM
jgi:hypothetical protein